MEPETPIERLLRWRLAQGEASAPPAPDSAWLLKMAQPWWKASPERFAALAGQLYAMQGDSGVGVPTLIVHAADSLATSVAVLQLDVRNGQLQLRFQLNEASELPREILEATVIAGKPAIPLLSSLAMRTQGNEYRLEAQLPDELACAWADLKGMEAMPFGLILRSEVEHE